MLSEISSVYVQVKDTNVYKTATKATAQAFVKRIWESMKHLANWDVLLLATYNSYSNEPQQPHEYVKLTLSALYYIYDCLKCTIYASMFQSTLAKLTWQNFIFKNFYIYIYLQQKKLFTIIYCYLYITKCIF